MSLPSIAYFYKDGKIVGAGSVNIGWFEQPEAVERCITEALIDSSRFYLGCDEPWYPKWKERMSMYFTTLEDLQQFQFMELYSWVIPRQVIKELIHDFTLSSEDFIKQLKEGRYSNARFKKDHD
jgi:hypothetical protein